MRLPRLVGEGRALEIIMMGRKVPADEALRIGLCERIAPEGQSRAAAEAVAAEIAKVPQAAVRADRQTVRETYGLPVREGLKREWANSLEARQHTGAIGFGRFGPG